MSKGLVLLTGGTGFIGTEIIRQLVDAGYPVRATTRTAAKAEEWGKINIEYKDKVEWVFVKDVVAAGALDEAVKGVVYVIHSASPFRYDIVDNEKELLIPAIQGAKNALEAAKRQPTVKHFVFTSSFAAHCDASKSLWPGHIYTNDDWNPATYDEAVKEENKVLAYCHSKALAERAIWGDQERTFPITTVSPPVVFGPINTPLKSMAEVNTSNDYLWQIIDGKAEDTIPDSPIPYIVAADVRDIAALHVRALTEPAARNVRVLGIAWHFFAVDLSECARKIFVHDPKIIARIRATPGKNEKTPHFSFDNSLALEVLGRPFISFEKSIKDTAESLYAWEAKLQN